LNKIKIEATYLNKVSTPNSLAKMSLALKQQIATLEEKKMTTAIKKQLKYLKEQLVASEATASAANAASQPPPLPELGAPDAYCSERAHRRRLHRPPAHAWVASAHGTALRSRPPSG
jgi:uncharacterized coiled-coil protein SlyX